MHPECTLTAVIHAIGYIWWEEEHTDMTVCVCVWREWELGGQLKLLCFRFCYS